MTQAQLLSIALLVGIAPITGSFMGVLVHRIPAGRKVGLDRSACDACGHVLGVVDLLPVVNWIVSLGRCRYCGVKVSAFYPLIELAALGVALWAWTVASGWQLWATSVLGWTLLVLALTNFYNRMAVDPVRSLSTSLIQSEKYGTPLGTALRVISEESRADRMAKVEEKAASLGAKLTVPMIAFFLPVIFLVVIGPAVIQMMQTF